MLLNKILQTALLSIYLFVVPDRPKRLLILLNPASGKFKGQEIYEKVAAPLFEMAGVETNIIGTSIKLNLYFATLFPLLLPYFCVLM